MQIEISFICWFAGHVLLQVAEQRKSKINCSLLYLPKNQALIFQTIINNDGKIDFTTVDMMFEDNYGRRDTSIPVFGETDWNWESDK